MTASLLDQLRALQRAWSPQDPCTTVVLVDQAAVAEARGYRALARKRTAINLLDLSGDPLDGASPVAIDISDTAAISKPDSPYTADLAALLESAKWACGLAVVQTSLPFQELCSRLKSRFRVHLPDNFDAILRYADTRILPVMLDVLSPQQRAAFFGIANHWAYLNRQGLWTEVQEVVPSAEDPTLTPLRLSESQQSALIAAAEIDFVLGLLREQEHQALRGLAPPQQYDRTADAVALAHGYNISATPDIAAFCSIALAEREGFHAEEPWRSELQAVQNGLKDFRAVLETLE